MGAWIWRAGTEADGALSPEEGARVERLLDAGKRATTRRFLLQRRQLLAQLLARAASEVRIGHDGEGRPFLPDFPDIAVSLSDSEGWNALVITSEKRVGIDIEAIRALGWQAMLPMMAGADEAERIRAAVEAAGHPVPFFRAWAVKEAVLKAAGTGMRGGAPRVRLTPGLLQGQSDRAYIVHEDVTYDVQTMTIPDYSTASPALVVTRALPA